MTESAAPTMADVQVRLIREVLDCCNTLGIDFCLLDAAALGAIKNQPEQLERPRISAGVRAADFVKLIEALRETTCSRPRILESWASSATFEEYGALYLDTETFYLPLGDLSERTNPYMGIQIIALREEPPNRKRRLAQLCTAYELLHQDFDVSSAQPGRLADAGRAARGMRSLVNVILGSPDRALKLFGAVYDNPNSLRVFTRSDDGSIAWCARESIFPVRFVRFAGTTVPIPGNDAYFEHKFGAEWRTTKRRVWSPDRQTLFSPAVSFDSVRATLPNPVEPIAEFVASRDKLASTKERLASALGLMQPYWDIVRRTSERFLLWQQIMPKKEAIVQLYEMGAVAQVKKILAPYTEAIERYAGLNLGLCFDEDLLEIELDLLRRSGKNDLADRAEALVPEAHRVPIVLEERTSLL